MNATFYEYQARQCVTVEVFKTDVTSEAEARRALEKLRQRYPSARINFDLEDCDKILRFQIPLPAVEVEGIIACLRTLNISAEVLE